MQVDERIALAEDFAGRPVASPKLPPRVTIRENGVRFRVRFEGGHKTGFFCDQRDNRRDLARFCRDRSVLDVCCYTGGFGLNALVRGGAREVTASTSTRRPSPWPARTPTPTRSGRRSSTPTPSATCARWAPNGRTFGVVVLDPPKLIPGRLDIASGKRKYFDLNVLAMSLVEPGGLLLTCSCSGLLSAEEFLILLRAAARQGGAVGAGARRDRRGARPSGRPRRARRGLPQGRLAPHGRPRRPRRFAEDGRRVGEPTRDEPWDSAPSRPVGRIG